MAQTLLEIDRLSVRFGASTVVDDVSFSIDAGEKFALVGESGSGKSITALSLLRLVDAATTTGAIRFGGEDLMRKSEREMRGIRGASIGMIFQEPMTALNPLYTVGNQIGEVLELHEAMRPNAARARAIELLARTGIPEPEKRIDAFPHQLSGGQRQRAMIAMALACKPRLLICDEPTTALDVTIQAQILALLDELQAEMGMALLFITHDLNLVRRFTHRVGVMERGRLVELGATAGVFGARMTGGGFGGCLVALCEPGTLSAKIGIFGARAVQLRSQRIGARGAFGHGRKLGGGTAEFCVQIARLGIARCQPITQIGNRPRGKEPRSGAPDDEAENKRDNQENRLVHYASITWNKLGTPVLCGISPKR